MEEAEDRGRLTELRQNLYSVATQQMLEAAYLKPGGRLSTLVWSKPEHNPLFAPYVILVNTSWEAEHPQEKASDPFSLADAAFFASRLTEAGFREVQVQIIPLTFHFPSFEVLTTWWGTPFKEALKKLDPASIQRVQKEMQRVVRPFKGSQGIVAPAELLLGTGMK